MQWQRGTGVGRDPTQPAYKHNQLTAHLNYTTTCSHPTKVDRCANKRGGEGHGDGDGGRFPATRTYQIPVAVPDMSCAEDPDSASSH